ncbi:MAG: GNAT family N-acetyltransferase [Proteobacteria bacterium]|nr:GNAT family N-acetyltransferase [Pseudomonadota bacterium]
MAEPGLETGRLTLRLPESGDLAWQQQWLNAPAVMRHLGGVRDPVDLETGFAANDRAMVAGLLGFWTVVLRDSGELIGKCGIGPIDSPHAPTTLHGGLQVGWSLAEPFWNRGFASEAARAAITDGFARYGAAEIWSQTSDSNQASTRMMARLGLRHCPELDYVDPDYPTQDNPTTIYRVARTEWHERAIERDVR